MSERVTAVVPVKDGARYLRELLDALVREGVDEALVIDSGSRDGSLEIARAAGATVLEIRPEEFRHGRTRNFAAERATGDVIAFLTQDATPLPGWRSALREGFALSDDVGVVFGPHLPRDGTSPMIARELTEFFATFAPPDAPPRVYGPDDPTFLSNVNAAYRRACWEQIRFEDVAYAEDQAFGRALAADQRWRKVFHPRAAVLHAHDYPPLEFMRRYFDEYRGLRETIGHVEPIAPRSSLLGVRTLVAADRRYMAEHDVAPGDRARWTARSLAHHTGRKVFSVLGSRAHALPLGAQRALSLEGRAGDGQPPSVGAPPAARLPALRYTAPEQDSHPYALIARVLRDGPAPLLPPYAGMSERRRLHIALAIPTFNIGSGGHNIIFQLVLRLERMGHVCTLWVHDLFDHRPHDGPAVMRREIVNEFAPVKAAVFREFDDWFGADVVVATGWQTVYPVLALEGCRARAYLVNDHEPEFFATSVDAEWAAQTYRMGLHGIVGSPWLRDLYVERYGGQAGTFQYGVDHDVYLPRPIERRRDTVVAYARAVTPRRAVALGILALAELRRRRPDVRIVLFGDPAPPRAPFEYEHAGVAGHEELSWLYSQATVGLCLSMTNYSLIPQEMLACGLPCVELDRPSPRSVFGADGPVALADQDPYAIADALERVLDDEGEWARRSRLGLDFVRDHTWDAATAQVERELRNALRARERQA
jgi:glycosyltransferase involved in cell wall biosynthesis/GT2 family glycosyltransferase